MRKMLFILSIFGASLIAECMPLEAAAASPAAAEAGIGLFKKDGVNHKSAKRFKSPRRVRRSKFACTRKKGCWGHKVKMKHVKDSSNCKKRS